MFTTINHFSQKPRTKQYYRLGSLLSVLSSQQLLNSKELDLLLQEIKTHTQLPDMHFTQLYQEVIDNFAEMVQLLPFEEEGVLGGILNRGIARAVLGLRLYCTEYVNEQDPLMAYGIFTACLLFDLGKLLTHYVVVLIDSNAEVGGEEELTEWQPLTGSMLGQAQYYKLFPKNPHTELQHEVTALLARQVMSMPGFLWLASDNSILNDWLLILRGAAHTGVGRLCHIFSLLKYEDIQELFVALGQPLAEQLDDFDYIEAEKFYHWLRDANVSNIQSGLYFLDGQLYASGQLLQDYVQTKNLQVTQERLRHQVEQLFSFMQHEVGKNQQIRQTDVKHQQQANKTATLGFLQHKKNTANAIALPAHLILGQSVLEQLPSMVHQLPVLKEKTKRAFANNAHVLK